MVPTMWSRQNALPSARSSAWTPRTIGSNSAADRLAVTAAAPGHDGAGLPGGCSCRGAIVTGQITLAKGG